MRRNHVRSGRLTADELDSITHAAGAVGLKPPGILVDATLAVARAQAGRTRGWLTSADASRRS